MIRSEKDAYRFTFVLLFLVSVMNATRYTVATFYGTGVYFILVACLCLAVLIVAPDGYSIVEQ